MTLANETQSPDNAVCRSLPYASQVEQTKGPDKAPGGQRPYARGSLFNRAYSRFTLLAVIGVFFAPRAMAQVCDPSCSTCSGPLATQCTACPAGWTLNAGRCCHNNCATCTGPLFSQCTACKSGFALFGTSCLECHQNCLTCTGGTATTCTTCKPGFTKTGTTCSDGWCHANCMSCFGKLNTQCTSCANGYILQGNTCITAATGCSAGYLLDAFENICRPSLCAVNCETCWDSAATSCLSCAPGYILQDYQCRPKNLAVPILLGCDATYRLDGNDQTCKRTIYDVDYPCQPGTVNTVEGASSKAQCLSCGAGLYCESFANAIGGSDCLAGHFCESNSNTRSPKKEYDSYAMDIPNPTLSYPDPKANTDPTGPVPFNYFEGYDTTDPANPIAKNDICQPGGYSGAGMRRCTSCSGGKYCPHDWMKDETNAGTCRAGFYCVQGVTKPTPNNPLPVGASPKFQVSTTKLLVNPDTLNTGFVIEQLETITQGNICPVGSYCDAGVSVAKQCDPGFFLPYLGGTAVGKCLPCPAGLYCPTSGFGDPFASLHAAPSTYSIDGNYVTLFRDYKTASSQTYWCTAGYFCESGSSVAQATPCLQDYYCPKGTRSMIPCAPNEYTTGKFATVCLTCPDGSNCVGQGAAITCSSNQYCKDSIVSYCKPGRNSGTNFGNILETDKCAPCPNSNYCQQPTTLSPCADGYYCKAQALATGYGSRTPRPNNPAEFNPLSNTAGQDGGICTPGFYCKAAQSALPIQCVAGQYCGDFGLADTQGPCREGYVCPATGGATTPIGSFDGTNFMMSICPAGSFCPTGTAVANKCPVGTYSTSMGAAQASDCKVCPASAICIQEGVSVLIDATNINHGVEANYCSGGVYCPPGAAQLNSDSGQYDCSIGYRCPTANPADAGYDNTIINVGQFMMLCEAGTYQQLPKQEYCTMCEPGFYCDYEDPTNRAICPAGFYCAAGTKVANQYPCPVGYYSTQTGKTVGTDCQKCDLGFYCSLTGQQAPTAKIVARYHGNGKTGQSQPNPFLCPFGAYCPEGAGDSISCPDGTWTSGTGMDSSSQCIPCVRGRFCRLATMRSDANYIAFKNTPGNEAYTLADLEAFAWFKQYYDSCTTGYICKEGSSTPTPLVESTDNGYPCPVGSFCQAGFVIEKPCEPGTYNDLTLQGTCKSCPIGEYCPNFGMTAGIQCIAGHYCPVNTIYPNPCPAGTIVPKNADGTNKLGLTAPSACEPCPASNYCENVGDVQPTGLCSPGFICGPGQDRPGPYATLHNPLIPSSNGRCPAKSYCTMGATQGLGCEDGKYQDNEQQSECFSAPPGKYCQAGTCQDCDYGYYCSGGNKVKNPGSKTATVLDTNGDICPVQNYCPVGSGAAKPCDAGSMQPNAGRWTCDACTIGYICLGNGIKQLCPSFNYCDGDTIFTFGKLCPAGFYGDKVKTGYTKQSDCKPCTQSHFCTAGRITGECVSGYICNKEASSPNPNTIALKSSGKAYPCPSGYWCSQGASEPEPCPLGYYTFESGGRQEADCTICPIGYYCSEETKNPKECPPGYYCEIGSWDPQPCPAGSYNPKFKSGSVTDCLPCKGGYTCPQKALGNINQQGDKFKCPLGHYCPQGYDNKPIPCIEGSFYDSLSSNANGTDFVDVFIQSSSLAVSIKDCQLCPEHYFCPQGTDSRYNHPCPSGNICPPGSGAPLLCPPGFYCRNVRGIIQKKVCPVGYYCPIGTDTPHRCQPGTVCAEGSSSEAIRGMTPDDCKPGEYLNVDKCFKCEPGFVCDSKTKEKYPIYSKTEGGYECPPGNYCPAGTQTASIKPCPPGTYRLLKNGKSINDCSACPDGSSQPDYGQTTCILCGRGATHSEDRTSCNCIGAFRTWLQSSNECVCQTGYFDPVVTQADETSAINLDCKPLMKPFCKITDFVNSKNECQSKSSCRQESLCGGKGKELGDYDDTLNTCYCKGATSEPTAYCDSNCQSGVLKAYFTNKNEIVLEVGKRSETFPASEFEDDIFLEGLYCPKARCEITATIFTNGNQAASAEADQVFVDAWRQYVDSSYRSPYGKRERMLATNTTDFSVDPTPKRVRSALRNLQAQVMQQSIQCISQYDAVSFALQAPNHFPVFVKDSPYNSDPNYDFGSFIKLKNKMLLSQLSLKSFPYTFRDLGVFAFGDYSEPDVVDTLVVVTDDVQATCDGIKQWPLTRENIQRLGIKVDVRKMISYDYFLHALPVIAVLAVFTLGYVQHMVEQKIEAREFDLRAKRENMMKLKHYFKKKEANFDTIGYLGDMYKLMQEYLDKINALIAENERAVAEEDAANIRRMLKDKYSVYDKLDKDGKIRQINEIEEDVKDMLENLRTKDGRTLMDLYRQMEIKKQLALDEERLKALHEKKKQEAMDNDEEESEEASELQFSDATSEKSENKSEEDRKSEEEDDIMGGLKNIDPDVADDWRRIREEIEKKKREFKAQVDPNLSKAEQEAMIRLHSEQMKELERDMRKEKEQQDQLLKKKMKDRQRKDKKTIKEVNTLEKDKTDEIASAQELINDLQSRKATLEANGIKTKTLKHERENEFQTKMKELEEERQRTLADMRNEYLERIRKSKDPLEKEKLLEEMGKRMNQVEESRKEEQQRQEATLKKMLKERQKKEIRKEIREIEKQVEQIEHNIDKVTQDVDEDKAKAYADAGAVGLLDPYIKDRKDKLFEKLAQNFTGFNNQLNDQEKDDIRIQEARLQMEKEKEIRSAEVEIDERIDKEALYKLQELEKEQARFRKELADCTDPEEQKRLLSELEQIQKEIIYETENEKRNMDRILELKRSKRRQYIQIKKMEVEQKQLEEVNAKEIELNQKKFDEQMHKMDESVNAELEKQIRLLMNHEGPNKEQALILIDQVEDELLAKKLKILMSKQFFDLTKYLGTMQGQLGLGHMMRVREIKMAYEKDKQELLDRGISGHQLELEVQRLAQQMETEQLISAEHMKRETAEKDSEIRERKEKDFSKEKRDMENLAAERKRQKIRDAMERFPDDRNVQDVGNKLLKRINNTLTEKLVDIEKETQKNLEKARLKLIADDQQTLVELQRKMHEDMMKAEEELDEKMKERKQNILNLKKQNLDDRIKMAADELSDFQIKEMRQQLNREYEQLEEVIRNEKDKQLRGMRAAMLERRIKKERKRKAELAELRQQELREQSNQVTDLMSKALKNKFLFNMGIKQEMFDKVKTVDQLLAKLVTWEKGVAEVREERGGEEGHIWNLQYSKEKEDEEKAKIAKFKDEERRKKQMQIDFTVRELFKRIARVEKLSDKMRKTQKHTHKSSEVASDLNHSRLVPAQQFMF